MGLSEENFNANRFVSIEAKSIFERNLIFSKNEKTEKTETQISFEAKFRLGFESFHEFRGFLKKNRKIQMNRKKRQKQFVRQDFDAKNDRSLSPTLL